MDAQTQTQANGGHSIFVIRRSDDRYLGCRARAGAAASSYTRFVDHPADAWAFDSKEEADRHVDPLRQSWPMFEFSVTEV